MLDVENEQKISV
nr:cag pathogenicity island protein [Helicobacter pylori F16]BAD13812.1 cag pathogenicity island protein [Helicobacter pylori]BAD13894.1 cag pathogenicity island protein [Helicobacter pylori]BAD13921.1 cag pathogenicity island protein [Helicobacter pylori]BAD13949.1 cag pathogenicity island protein [Helicobacter pylori]